MEPIKWALFLIFLISVNEARVIEQEIANSDSIRTKRDNKPRFVGQTQSQYLNFGASDDGKAEAEATQGGSRATVYGKNGMGQAQSMSVGNDCSDCYDSHHGYRDSDRPDPIRQIPGERQIIVDGTGKVINRPGVAYQIGDSRAPGGIGTFTGDSQPQNGWTQSGDGSRIPGKQGTVVQPTSTWHDTQRPGQVILDNNGRILSKPDATYQTFDSRPSQTGSNGKPTVSTSGFPQPQGPISGYPEQQHISTQDTHRTNGLPIGPGYQQGQSGLRPDKQFGQDGSPGTRVIPTANLSTYSDSSPKIPGISQTGFPGSQNQNGRFVPDRPDSDTGTSHYNVNDKIQPGFTSIPGGSQSSVNGKTQPGIITQIPGISQHVNGKIQPGTNGQSGTFHQSSGTPQRTVNGRTPQLINGQSGTHIQSPGGFQTGSTNLNQDPENLRLTTPKPHVYGSFAPGQINGYSSIGDQMPENYTSRRGAHPGHAGGVFTTGPDGKPQFVPFPPGDHTVYNPNGGLTVLVGTGGPKQTVIGTGKRFDGPFRILPGSPSGQKIPGVAQQTVYTPGGGLTVLVGTGGPHQTVYQHPHDYEQSKVGQHAIPSDISSAEIDNFTKDDQEQRGDIPGHLIMPGQIPAPRKDGESDKIGGVDSTKPSTFVGPDGKIYTTGAQPQQPGTQITGQQPGTYVGPDGRIYSIGTQPQQPGTQITGQQPGTYISSQQPGSQVTGQQPGTYVGPDGRVYTIGTQPQQPGTQITGQQPGTYIGSQQPGSQVTGQQPGTYVGPDGRVYSVGTQPQQPGTQITGQQPGTYISGQQPGTYVGPDGKVYSIGTQPQQPGTQITGQQPGTYIGSQQPGSQVTGQQPGTYVGPDGRVYTVGTQPQQPGTQITGQQPGTYVGPDGKVYSIGTQPQQPGTQISGQQPGTYIGSQQPGSQVTGQQPGTYVGPDGRVYSVGTQPQQPGTQITGQQPGTYIGSQQPGSQVTGQQPGTYVGPDGRVYSVGTQPQQPGTQITGQQPGTYISGQQPGTYVGTDGRVYSIGTQPQQPGTQITGQQPGTYISGQQPGTYVGPDGKVYSIGTQPQQPGTQITGQQPGSQVTGQQPGTYISGQQPGTYVGPDGRVYSVGTQPQQPGTQITGQQPGSQVTGQQPGTYVGPDGKVYSIGTQPQQPGSQVTGQQPGSQVTGQQPGTYVGPDGKVYSIGTQPQQPGSQVTGQQPGSQVTGQQPGTYVGPDGKVYSIGTQPQQPGSQVTGQQPGSQVTGQQPGTYVGPDGKVYSIGTQPQQPGSQVIGQQPGTYVGPDGKVYSIGAEPQQPGTQITGQQPGSQVTGQQPGTYVGPDGKVYSIGTQPQQPGSQVIGQQPGTYVGPDGKVYSIGTQPHQPGSQVIGQQPGTYVGPDGRIYSIGTQPQQPGSQVTGQQQHNIESQKLPGIQVPFVGPDGKVIYQQPKIDSLGGIPGQAIITSEQCLGGSPCSGDVVVSQQNETAPENLEKSEDDEDDFAQAESTIKGGEVIASAQGRKNGGTAETQVSGTYTGNGSFSATAQTSDKERSAQAQISGGKDGAKTSSQGSGGKAKSQAEIAVNSKTGGTSATSQSGGKGYESQSEVVADEKGGLADAQSSGPGQTSSQAQIGFRPQEEDPNEAIYSVFNGGGTASAQSGAKTGQSQAQINGKFSKYGIAYHGAAQTGSGTKEQVKKIRDESRALFRNIELFGKSNKKIEIRSDTDDPNLRTRNSKHTAITSFSPTIPSLPQIIATTISPISVDDEIEYDEEDEYDEGGDDDYYTQPNPKLPNNLEHKSNGKMFVTESSIGDVVTIISEGNTKIFSQSSPTQKQTVVVNTDRPFRLTQTQNGKTFTYPPKPKEDDEKDSSEIPENLSVFNKNKHSDEKSHKISPQNKYSTRYLPSKTEVKDEDKSGNVVKITNSFSDSNDDSSNDKSKFASTYFTKSTNCGHVTFSCNIIYGKNGRSKVCRPKQTTGKC